MGYFTEINLRRAQKAVIAQYNQELKLCMNSDVSGYYRENIQNLSINNPVRDKATLVEIMSSKNVAFCKESKVLLITKYLETHFTQLKMITKAVDYTKLTLLTCFKGDDLTCYRVFGLQKNNGYWIAELASRKLIIPNNPSVFQYNS